MVKCPVLRQTLDCNAEVNVHFRDHAADIAALAEAIAGKLRSVCNILPHQACAAGLFMDCGEPVLMQRFPGYRREHRSSPCGGWPNLLEQPGLNADGLPGLEDDIFEAVRGA